jgi:2-methylcitrate dehydratase PrpD
VIVEVTRELARFVVAEHQLPPEVEHAARRILLNVVSLAAAGSRHPAAVIAADVVAAMETPPRAGVLGTSTRVAPQWAAFLNGIAAHVEDFDDTHLVTIIHPGPPIMPAALAVAEEQESDVAELLVGIAIGVEIALRIGVGLGPVHRERGWHVSGTLGVIGASAAAARLMGLDEDSAVQVIGLAATQAAGIQAAFGTHTKAFHCGHAAESGIEAAGLVALGFTAPTQGIEGKHSMAALMTADADLNSMVSGIGSRWEILANVEKPYACGVVSHPTLDAARRLRDRVKDISEIESVQLIVNPIVLDLMGVRDPQTGSQSKFSVYHCAAVGLLDGSGGPREFSDQHAQHPEVMRLRALVEVTPDELMGRGETRMVVHLRGGRSESLTVDSVEPLSDERLRQKAQDLLEPVLGERANAAVKRLDGLQPNEPAAAVLDAVRPATGG